MGQTQELGVSAAELHAAVVGRLRADFRQRADEIIEACRAPGVDVRDVLVVRMRDAARRHPLAKAIADVLDAHARGSFSVGVEFVAMGEAETAVTEDAEIARLAAQDEQAA